MGAPQGDQRADQRGVWGGAGGGERQRRGASPSQGALGPRAGGAGWRVWGGRGALGPWTEGAGWRVWGGSGAEKKKKKKTFPQISTLPCPVHSPPFPQISTLPCLVHAPPFPQISTLPCPVHSPTFPQIKEFEALSGRRPRVLVAKMGQDGHDRGARVRGGGPMTGGQG